MVDKQADLLEKLRMRGWKAVNYITNPAEGVAFIMNAPGAVAILYPDGSLDRQITPKSPIQWRSGYRDLRADKKYQERQEQFDRGLSKLVKFYYDELRRQHA